MSATSNGITATVDAATFAFVGNGGMQPKLRFRSDVLGGSADRSVREISDAVFSTGDYLLFSTGEALVWVVDRFQVFPFGAIPKLPVAGNLYGPRLIPIDAVARASSVGMTESVRFVSPSNLQATPTWASATIAPDGITLSYSD